MTRAELTDQIAALCDGTDLPLREKVVALKIASTRVQMNVSLGVTKPKKVAWSRKPLLRPSGNVMGRQRREPKS